MSDSTNPEPDGREQDPSSAAAGDPTRRVFLRRSGTATMVGGMAAGYGVLGYCGVRFLMPQGLDENLGWQFVSTLDDIRQRETYEFTASSGAKVVIARRGEGAVAEDYVALSSVCPHLGCQVFWESAEERFFCPCHNGTFDAAGKATSGPPADAGQFLTQFPLQVINEALYVQAPVKSIVDSSRRVNR